MRDDIKWVVEYIDSMLICPTDMSRQVRNWCFYYGDFLAVQTLNRHITWCSYMNVGGNPQCTALIAWQDPRYFVGPSTGVTPSREPLRACLEQAINEIQAVVQGGGWDAAKEFIANICNIVGQPKVTPEHMFYYATVTMDKKAKRKAHKEFLEDKEKRDFEYTTTFIDPEFDEEVTVIGNKYTSR